MEKDVLDLQQNDIDYIDEENSVIIEDTEINAADLSKIQVVSKDWTLETIFSQINQGNINLNPEFQRRNAWNDKKRNQLIESLILGFPIPEIVLAENPNKKRSYIVIDGKQRLSTIAGFLNTTEFKFWENPKLKGLQIRNELNDLTFNDLKTDEKYEEAYRQLMNASTRCTIIVTDYEKNNDILYHIFYRLNTSSVPLATQELRQVLHKGDFANYLVEITKTKQPLHEIMGLDGPDKRLADIEIILKFISFTLFGKEYKSNLKKFLDDSMKKINKDWEKKYKDDVKKIYIKFNNGISNLKTTFQEPKHIGRKFQEKWVGRFNRNLFEVLVFYFQELVSKDLTQTNNDRFIEGFKKLFDDPIFLPTVESNTKQIESYRIRYNKIKEIVSSSFNKKFDIIPVIEK